MKPVSGESVALIIESLARKIAKDAEERCVLDLRTFLANKYNLDEADVPQKLIVSLLHASSSQRALNDVGSELMTTLRLASDADYLVISHSKQELIESSKTFRFNYVRARNQASHVKSVLRPLSDTWLRRWAEDRPDFNLDSARLSSNALRGTSVNEHNFRQWTEEVIALFQKTAVDQTDSTKKSDSVIKRTRGTVSEAGSRAYRNSWQTFVREKKSSIFLEMAKISESKIDSINALESSNTSTFSLTESEVDNFEYNQPRSESTYESFSSGSSLSQKYFNSFDEPTQTNESSRMSKSESLENLRNIRQSTVLIEVKIKSKDRSIPEISRTWSKFDNSVLEEFENWIVRLMPVLSTGAEIFSGSIETKTADGTQSVSLESASAKKLIDFGKVLLGGIDN